MTRAVDHPDSALALAVRGKREGRVFALTLMAGFLFVAVVAYWKEAATLAGVASALAAISLLAAALVPGRLEPVRRAWMRLGELIGYVTTPILLAIVYYGVVTPIGAIRRLTGATRRTEANSSWHRRPPLPPAKRMERQF